MILFFKKFSKQTLDRVLAAALIGSMMLVPTGAFASTLVVDRGLPTDNLNNVSGANRSNVAWAFGSNYWVADSFGLATGGVIDRLTTWLVTSPSAGSDFGSVFSGLSLYLGSSAGSQIANVSSANFTGNSSDNVDVSVSAVTYSGGANYQSTSGSFLNIWEVTFTNLGLFAAGEYLFALTGSPLDNLTFMHASDAALGGVPADGADNMMYYLYGLAGGGTLDIGGTWDSNGNDNGWDKSSDVNVSVYLTAVPIPMALPMLLGALGFFGGMSVLRRRVVAA